MVYVNKGLSTTVLHTTLGNVHGDFLAVFRTHESIVNAFAEGNTLTRVTANSYTSLDHVFVHYNDMINVSTAVFHTCVMDHYSTTLTVTTPVQVLLSSHLHKLTADYSQHTCSGSTELTLWPQWIFNRVQHIFVISIEHSLDSS